MALFDFNKLLKDAQKTAENLKNSVVEKAQNLPDNIKNINIGNAVNDLAQKGQEAITSFNRRQADFNEKVSSAMQENEVEKKTVSFMDAFRIIYCLMAVDGCILRDEEEKLNAIGKELDSNFVSYQTAIGDTVSAIQGILQEEGEDLYDAIHDYVGEILLKAQGYREGLRARILIWDLLTVAYSEENYSAMERRLIRYIAKNLGVDKAVCLEMDQTIQTLMAIEKEETWLKNSDRTFRVIEARINELADRKDAIMTGITALLED